MILLPEANALAAFCRDALQIGLSLLLPSTLLLGFGLLLARAWRQYGPEAERFACRAVLGVVAASILTVPLLAGRVRPLWGVQLPPVSSLAPSSPAGPVQALKARPAAEPVKKAPRLSSLPFPKE